MRRARRGALAAESLYDVLIVVGYNHAPVQSPPCATR
jgi:hypothetical protein